MKRLVLALAAAGISLTAAAAMAQDDTSRAACNQWRHGECISWHRMAGHRRNAAAYQVGYDFGPHYSYVPLGALPPPVVARYHLGTGFRYVRDNERIYLVNPHTYRVVRVIALP